MVRFTQIARVSGIVVAASPPIHIHHNSLLDQCSQSTPLPQHYSKDWSIFAKAMNIARDVYSALKKAQQLCKLKPKVRECLCECFTQHAGAFTGRLILPLQAFDFLKYCPFENISASPTLRRASTRKRATGNPTSLRSSQHASKRNSAAASAAPTSKRPRTPQRATACRVIRQPSQHAYSAAASAAPTSKRPSIPKRETRRLTIGESSQHSCVSRIQLDVLNSAHMDMRMIT